MPPERVTLAYGKATRTLSLPPGVAWSVPEPAHASPAPLDAAAIDAALATPTSGPPLAERLQGASRVVIAVPDRTRAAALERLLPPVLEAIDAGAPALPVTVLSGGGTHAPDDVQRVEALLPPHRRSRVTIGVHDATDASAHLGVGWTSRRTPVSLDRRIVEGAPLVVVLGTVGFHYFAGFAGGRKGIFPGLAAYESVRANHRLVLDESRGGIADGCRPGNLAGNPVHADMIEAARLTPGPAFLVNVMLDEQDRMAGVYTGDLERAHASACRAYRDAHTFTVPAPADLAVIDAGGHPRDIDLIQSHKSLVHAAPALRDGGALVVLAACPEGVGSQTFLPWFDHGSAERMAAAIGADYQLNAHTALSFRRLTERFEVFMVTDLDERIVSSVGATAVATVEEALSRAVTPARRTGVVLRTPTRSVIERGGGDA